MGKIIKNTILIIVIITLSASTAFLVYLHFFAAGDENLTGEWTADIDMKKQAAATAYSWLQDIEAVSVSLEDIESYMPELTVQVNLVMEQTARYEGTFRSNTMTKSYETCSQAAYEAFAAAFKELTAKRLNMAGYEAGTDDEDIEALIVETFGMSTVSYLKMCVPDLLPSLEELQSCYDGSGTYEISEGVLTRHFEGRDEIRTERCIRQNADMILYEEAGLTEQVSPVIYILKQIQAQ